MLKNYRNIFQFLCDKKLYKTLDDIFFSKYKIYNYKKYNNRLIIYNSKKININDLNTNFGKDFANQLGDFYICADNNKIYYDSTNRIIITVEHKLKKINTTFNIYLYAQMCKESFITDENINKLKKIAKEISSILKLFDKNLVTLLKINKIKKILGIPYKGIKDKQFIFN